MTELSDHLAAQYDIPESPEQRKDYKLRDDDHAEWAAGMLRRYTQQLADKQGQAARQMALVAEWLNAETARVNHRINWFTAILEEYALVSRIADDRKTVDLPSAAISTKAPRDVRDITDRDEFILWAIPNAPELLNISPAKAELNKLEVYGGALVYDEQIIPGVTVVPGSTPTASVKLK